jgi:hypothetical protein
MHCGIKLILTSSIDFFKRTKFDHPIDDAPDYVDPTSNIGEEEEEEDDDDDDDGAEVDQDGKDDDLDDYVGGAN